MATQTPQDPAKEAARKQAAEDKAALDKLQAEQYAKATAGKPTPTQAEHDRIAMGERVELEDDGSGPDPNSPEALRQARKGK